MQNKAPNSKSAKSRSNAQMQAANPMLNPGDEAARGTPGTGEDICPECHGKGRVNGALCPNCGGSGSITRAIGGARIGAVDPPMSRIDGGVCWR